VVVRGRNGRAVAVVDAAATTGGSRGVNVLGNDTTPRVTTLGRVRRCRLGRKGTVSLVVGVVTYDRAGAF
jgi:hypothetical protein